MTLASGIGVALFFPPQPLPEVNLVHLNEITNLLSKDFERLDDSDYPLPSAQQYDYSVIDSEGVVVVSTKPGLSTGIYEAAENGDIVLDLTRDDHLFGKVIFSDDDKLWAQNHQNSVRFVFIVTSVMMALICLLLYLSVYRNVLRPFARLQGFAKSVASGNLDIPLERRRRNVFGAYTESLDLMREELKRAQENERNAVRSKRDLVAALSHDMQAPVASIQAAVELLGATATDVSQREIIQAILEKVEQTHILLSDLFITTLQEHEEYRIDLSAVSNSEVLDIIERCDYRSRTQGKKIPDCLIYVDPTRLEQVIDNIIGNSYKYADTKIDVSAVIEGYGLSLIFRDYGPGVFDDDLNMLTSKFYRGKGSENQEGYGLGLYIAHRLLEHMGGEIVCSNESPGFGVKIWLKLDGVTVRTQGVT